MLTDSSINDNKGIFYYCWAETYVKAFLGQNNFGRTFVGAYKYSGSVTTGKDTKLQ